ncbi:hypothetical protein K438DRAFT_269680 [Mycena galopus ATCC 62051]|nr:hypothetical protein K438DRAFT_269680 [Mycena galopus ATCC 62051]
MSVHIPLHIDERFWPFRVASRFLVLPVVYRALKIGPVSQVIQVGFRRGLEKTSCTPMAPYNSSGVSSEFLCRDAMRFSRWGGVGCVLAVSAQSNIFSLYFSPVSKLRRQGRIYAICPNASPKNVNVCGPIPFIEYSMPTSSLISSLKAGYLPG